MIRLEICFKAIYIPILAAVSHSAIHWLLVTIPVLQKDPVRYAAPVAEYMSLHVKSLCKSMAHANNINPLS